MTIADVNRGLKACREATTLPWRAGGDVLMSDGPFPDWYPEYRLSRYDGKAIADIFVIKEDRHEDIVFAVAASEQLPQALGALHQIYTLLEQRGSLSTDDFNHILQSQNIMAMEMSDYERFNIRRENLFTRTADLENAVAGKYTECYDLVERGDIELAIAKIEALAIEQRR